MLMKNLQNLAKELTAESREVGKNFSNTLNSALFENSKPYLGQVSSAKALNAYREVSVIFKANEVSTQKNRA